MPATPPPVARGEQVLRLIEKAALVDPLSEAALVHLAQMKWHRSELAEAVALYDRAIELLRTKEVTARNGAVPTTAASARAAALARADANAPPLRAPHAIAPARAQRLTPARARARARARVACRSSRRRTGCAKRRTRTSNCSRRSR